MSRESKYKDVIHTDLRFLSTYPTYTSIIEEVMTLVDGTVIQGITPPAFVSTSTTSILRNARDFYLSLPGKYPSLFRTYCNDFYSSFTFRKLKKGDVPFGETTPIYGTNHTQIVCGYNNQVDDYTTAIHEYSHGIATMLNPKQFFDVEKYCIAETDGVFFELVGADYTGKHLGLKKEVINSTINTIGDNLLDLDIIYSKIKMYRETQFKWSRTNVEEYLKDLGYNNDGIQYFMNFYLKDYFHYIIAYLNAIELYQIYQQDKRSALDLLLRIIKKTDCSAKEQLEYIHSLGIHPGENVLSYFEHIRKQDQEVGYGKRLQYKIK